MINSPEAQFQYALKLPMQELTSIMQGKPSQISQSVAMMAMQKLKATKTAMQGQQAQQQLNKPSVKDQLVQESQMPESQGIGQLAAQNMNEVVRVAQGGIIGFADGTSVSAKYNQALRNSAPQSAIDYVGAAAADLASLPGQAVSWDWDEFERTGKLQKKYETSGFFPITRDVADMQAGRSEGYNTPQTSATSTGSNVAFDPMRGGVQLRALKDKPTIPGDIDDRLGLKPNPLTPTAPGPRPAPMRGAPVASRIPSTRGEPEQMQVGPTSSQGIADLASTSTSAPTTTPPRTSETFDALQQKFKANTKPYMDEMTAAMKALTDSPEEKSARGEKRSGVMMMEAAGQLLTGGRSGAASRGAAFSSVGKLGQEYAKEDDAAKRAQIGAKITMLGAQAQLAQNDAKGAADMFQHAENLTQRYAHLSAVDKQNAAENEAKNRGLGLKEQEILGQQAYQREMIRITEKHHNQEARYKQQYLGVLGAKGTTFTPAQQAKIRVDVGKAVDKSLSDVMSPEYKLLQKGASKAAILEAHTNHALYGVPLELPGLQSMTPGQPGDVAGKIKLPNTP